MKEASHVVGGSPLDENQTSFAEVIIEPFSRLAESGEAEAVLRVETRLHKTPESRARPVEKEGIIHLAHLNPSAARLDRLVHERVRLDVNDRPT